MTNDRQPMTSYSWCNI